MKRNLTSTRLFAGAIALLSSGLMLSAQAQTLRASTLTGGSQATGGDSPQGAISGNGQYVVFTSRATNLIPNAFTQVFRKDLSTGITVLVSKDSLGNPAVGECANPRTSSNGQYVCFSTDAQLVLGDMNTTRDVYRIDVTTGDVLQVSVATGGAQADATSDSSSMSPDGKFIAFRSLSTSLVLGASGSQVYKRDVIGNSTTLASMIDGSSTPGAGNQSGISQTSISSDGRYVGFATVDALVPTDTNNFFDVYVRDTSGTETTSRISVAINGNQGNDHSMTCSMSDDGRYVTFVSNQGFVNGDNNGTSDVFMRDTVANTMTRMSVTTDNKQATGGASGHDFGGGYGARISGDGLRVVFQSLATNLFKGDNNGTYDVFVRNRSNNTTTLISVSTAGKVGNGASTNPTISYSSGQVAFVSAANNLIPSGQDSNGFLDVFRR